MWHKSNSKVVDPERLLVQDDQDLYKAVNQFQQLLRFSAVTPLFARRDVRKPSRNSEHEARWYMTNYKCHIMKRNSINLNEVDRKPLHNRSLGQRRPRGEGDIALSTHKKQVFLEKEIKSDDTLQSVALEFNVPVAELKRINNIHKDNEIYARKIIKVPSNPLSLLLEKEYFLGDDKLVPEPKPVPETCNVIVETVNNSNCAPKCLSDNITRQGQGKQSYKPQQGEVQESVSLLNTTVEHRTADVMSCNGADWGISWHALILVTLVLGVGGPMLYVFWILWGRKGKAEGS